VTTTTLIRVADLTEIPPETNKAFLVNDVSVLICHTSQGLFAVENLCSHQLATLEGGKMKSCYLFCPKHSVRFDLRTGQPAGNLTKTPVQTYKISVVDTEIFINLPI
jgi:3-phenylpropionate/trans-cinnamate dioxygenase ferredoxin subunit